jgi:hypothetical protein
LRREWESRVLPQLESEGRIAKDGRGWKITEQPDLRLTNPNAWATVEFCYANG